MQRLFDAGAIIRAERRDAGTDVCDVFVTYRRVGEVLEIVLEPSLRRTPEVEYDFDDLSMLLRRTSACRIASGKMSRSWESSQLGESE